MTGAHAGAIIKQLIRSKVSQQVIRDAAGAVSSVQVVPVRCLRVTRIAFVAATLPELWLGFADRSTIAAPGSVRYQATARSLASTLSPGAQVPVSQPPQRRRERLQGRVTTDSGAPIQSALVLVTMGPDRETRSDTTDQEGRWSVAFEQGAGDYLVHASVAGRLPARKRVTRTVASDSEYTVDLSLRSSIATLGAIRVQARRTLVQRRAESEIGAGPGESQYDVEGVNARLTPDASGAITSLAATTPGIAIDSSGGIAALGIAGQSSVTLGGLSFSADELPRDARTSARVVTSTYDPALGWFGSAQTRISFPIGGLFSSRRAHVSADIPGIQYRRPLSDSWRDRSSTVQTSLGGDGPFRRDHLGYSYGLQLTQRTGRPLALDELTPAGLSGLGIARDSLARLLSVLQGVGIRDAQLASAPKRSEAFSFIATVGRQSFDYTTLRDVRHVWKLTGYGSVGNPASVGLTPNALSTRGGTLKTGAGGLQASYSTYVGKRNQLLEFRSSVSGRADHRSPNLAATGGLVSVDAFVDLGDTPEAAAQSYSATQVIGFGGNSALQSRTRTGTWENQVELRLFATGKERHRIGIQADARLDVLSESQASDLLGTFYFQSIDDLAAKRPSSFSRSIATSTAAARTWNGYLAASDYWRPTTKLEVLYGARLEQSVLAADGFDSRLYSTALGGRPQRDLHDWHVSPRVGFTYTRVDNRRGGMTSGALGSLTLNPKSYLRGGFGEFRALSGPQFTVASRRTTNSSGSHERLSCTGASTPPFDWDAWTTLGAEAIPAHCVANQAALIDTAPAYFLIDRSYVAPRSWRGNLSWASAVGSVAYVVDGILALNVDQPSFVDANLKTETQFTLASDGRPIYVPVGAIDPRTGLVSSAESRRSPQLSRVLLLTSQDKSVARQLSVTLRPAQPTFSRKYSAVTYTFQRISERSFSVARPGVGGSSTANWRRSPFDVRHQILMQSGYKFGGMSVTAFGQVRSGRPFVPTIRSDINGDGFANDAALLGAASAHDGVTALGLRALSSTGTVVARRCLARMARSPFGVTTCDGPWEAALNLRLDAEGSRLKLGSRTSIGVVAANIVDGIDRAVHKHASARWGLGVDPDPALFDPRGFDASRREFSYRVNPRFGSADYLRGATNTAFRVMVDVAVSLGRPMAEQQLDRSLRPVRRGETLVAQTPEDLYRRYRCTVVDPFRAVLLESDSLLLSRDQVEALQRADTVYRRGVDSLWRDLADDIARSGARVNFRAALAAQERTTSAVWEQSRLAALDQVPRILTPAQLRVAPTIVARLIRATSAANYREYTPSGCAR